MNTSSFWAALESVPGNAALYTTWKLLLDSDFEAFKSLFLKVRPGPLADFVPCPWNCGCLHKVVLDPSDRMLGVCQCKDRWCDTYTVMHEERTTFEIPWSTLANTLAGPFQFQPQLVQLGIFNVQQLGTLSATAGSATACPATAVILSLASSQPELLNAVTTLVARLGRPFILLTPTSLHLPASAKEILHNIGAASFALEEHLQLTSSTHGNETHYQLSCTTPPAKLFAAVAPLEPAPSNDELARRAFLAIQEHKPDTRQKSPTLYTVFHLYCVKELSIPQVARKCHCSIGTVANRLKLLRAKTGVPPEELRRAADLFHNYSNDMNQAQRNYRKRIQQPEY